MIRRADGGCSNAIALQRLRQPTIDFNRRDNEKKEAVDLGRSTAGRQGSIEGGFEGGHGPQPGEVVRSGGGSLVGMDRFSRLNRSSGEIRDSVILIPWGKV